MSSSSRAHRFLLLIGCTAFTAGCGSDPTSPEPAAEPIEMRADGMTDPPPPNCIWIGPILHCQTP